MSVEILSNSIQPDQKNSFEHIYLPHSQTSNKSNIEHEPLIQHNPDLQEDPKEANANNSMECNNGAYSELYAPSVINYGSNCQNTLVSNLE